MEENKVNVVLLNDNFEPSVDGVVKTVLNYAKILSEKDIVSVVCPRYSNHTDEYSFPVYRMSSLRYRRKSYAVALRTPNLKIKRAIKQQDAQIYHAHSPFTVGHFALRVARKNHVPLVATFHSKYKDDFLEITKSKLLTRIAMKYIMNFYKKCDVVWTCSHDTANTLRSYGYTGEITVMQNGTDFVYPDNVSILKKKAKELYHIDGTKHNVLFVGQLVWQKNIRLIMDVAKVILERNRNYHFYFVGTSLIEKQVKEYAASLKITDHVSFTGVITDSSLLKGIFASCDLFFFPSFYDNAPLVLREAAVMKLPTLVSKGATCSEVIRDGENGFIEEPVIEKMAQKIEKIFETPELLKKCGEKASETIPIRWSKIVENVKEEYKKIILEYTKGKKR